MEYALIANSGIQMFTRRIKIDLTAGYKQLFYETFDDELFQWKLEFAYRLEKEGKYVRTAQLRQKGYMGRDGQLTTSEQMVLANPEIEVVDADNEMDAEGFFYSKLSKSNRHLEKLFGEWLPIPYIEVDETGDYKCGPYNWSRCKIQQRPTDEPGVIEADVLFAFDTRSVYGEDSLHECPQFSSETELEKHFNLCGCDGQLFDYCTWNESFVRDTILHIMHPGIPDFDQLSIESGSNKYAFLATYLTLMSYMSEQEAVPSVRLIGDRGSKKVSVEMIVDIGNSRTSGLLFEEQDFTRVDTLKLQDFTHPIMSNGALNRVDESFDMRLAFRKASFGANFMGSSQFVWPSLVRLGKESQYLSHAATALNLGTESISTYSSPKRYLWDYKAVENEWRLVCLDDENPNVPPVIEGLTNNLKDNGEVDPDGYGYGAHYSRRSLMTLAFIEILQQTFVQINSFEVRTANGLLNTPRRLDRIILTCPTAMSELERKSLHNALNEAIHVINQYNQTVDEMAPALTIEVLPESKPDAEGNKRWYFDEATCSQLVFMYGQLCKRYKNCSDRFFSLYGRHRTIEGVDRLTINVGAVDIGAGTTDMTVCQYVYDETNPSRIKPQPLFWDSFNQAGDDMLQVLIKNIIIEGDDAILSQHLMKQGCSKQECHQRLFRFFADDNNSMTFESRMMRRDFNVQVSVPVMYSFLDMLSHGEHYRELTYDDLFTQSPPSQAVLDAFRATMGCELSEVVWTYDREVVSRYVQGSMDGLVETLTTLLYAHDCDLVLLAGRPSLLPPLRECFLKYFSVSSNRLVTLGNYRMGVWYPFSDENGYLHDTKTLVPVGAMIGYLASRAGGLNDFSVDLSDLGNSLTPTTNYFVRVRAASKESCFITPDNPQGVLQVNSFPVYIGSKQYDNTTYPPRPFYVLDIDNASILSRINKREDLSKEQQYRQLQLERERLLSQGPFVVTLERDNGEEEKERLVVASVENVSGMQLNVSDFSLIVQSLNDPDCYWLDSGAFNLNIATVELKKSDNNAQ